MAALCQNGMNTICSYFDREIKFPELEVLFFENNEDATSMVGAIELLSQKCSTNKAILGLPEEKLKKLTLKGEM